MTFTQITSPVRETTSRPGLRVGRWSLVWRPRAVLICSCLVLVNFVLVCVNVAIGELSRTPWEVAQVLLGGGSSVDRLVIVDLRLPRTLVGVCVGACLGMSGALIQSITRNPLASPDIIGVTTGASAGAVAAIIIGAGLPAWVAAVGVPGAAVLGGLFAGLLIFTLSWYRGLDSYRVVLIGIGVNFALSSVISLLLVRAQINQAAQATVWLTGNLDGRGWDQLWPVLSTLLVVGTLTLVGAHALASLRLGDDSARALGVQVQPTRVLLLVGAVLLASAAASAAGPIAFVAFVAPQVMKRVLASPGEPLVGSALGGATLLLSADVVARVILPVELPVGIITAVVGAPYFLFLLLQRRKVSL